MSRSSAKRLPGFTIVELVVSLGIITVLTGMMLANFRGGQRASELRLAAEIAVTRIREVQTSALAGRQVAVCSGGPQDLAVCDVTKRPAVVCGTGGTCQDRAVPGYGIRFALGARSAVVFYDTNGNGVYDVGEELTEQPFVQSGTVAVASANVALPLDVVFRAPDGQMLFNGVTAPPEADLVLKHTASGEERMVKLFRITGKIDHD